MQPKQALILLLIIYLCKTVKAQDNLSAIDKVTNFPTFFLKAGPQTREQVQQQIHNQLASGGFNAQQYLQQNLQAAQSQLNTLKDKINKLGGGSGDMNLPDFKPSNQRTKTIWKWLEYGTNFQTVKNIFFPTITDFGLSVGYKLTDKSTVGVGASYKMGWGTGY